MISKKLMWRAMKSDSADISVIKMEFCLSESLGIDITMKREVDPATFEPTWKFYHKDRKFRAKYNLEMRQDMEFVLAPENVDAELMAAISQELYFELHGKQKWM